MQKKNKGQVSFGRNSSSTQEDEPLYNESEVFEAVSKCRGKSLKDALLVESC